MAASCFYQHTATDYLTRSGMLPFGKRQLSFCNIHCKTEELHHPPRYPTKRSGGCQRHRPNNPLPPAPPPPTRASQVLCGSRRRPPSADSPPAAIPGGFRWRGRLFTPAPPCDSFSEDHGGLLVPTPPLPSPRDTPLKQKQAQGCRDRENQTPASHPRSPKPLP